MKYSIFLMALLSGCAPAIRQGAPLMDKVPPISTNANPAVKPAIAALPEKWWKEFNDRSLDSLLDIAMSGNPGLDEAKDRLGEAQAVVDETGASLYPHVDSINEIRRQRLSRNGNHVIYNGKTATIANVFPLYVNYDLDLWNRNGEIVSAAAASEKGAEARYRQSALMLSSAVIKTYFALNAARNLAKTQAEIVRLTEEKADLLTAAYRTGIRPKTPSVSIHADLNESRVALATLENRRQSLDF
ncbi:MAG TPA: TolC family protein, partial [Burkholderiales bacterium]|nr:TolC family protein [Burkholderiales bacterium]